MAEPAQLPSAEGLVTAPAPTDIAMTDAVMAETPASIAPPAVAAPSVFQPATPAATLAGAPQDTPVANAAATDEPAQTVSTPSTAATEPSAGQTESAAEATPRADTNPPTQIAPAVAADVSGTTGACLLDHYLHHCYA